MVGRSEAPLPTTTDLLGHVIAGKEVQEGRSGAPLPSYTSPPGIACPRKHLFVGGAKPPSNTKRVFYLDMQIDLTLTQTWGRSFFWLEASPLQPRKDLLQGHARQLLVRVRVFLDLQFPSVTSRFRVLGNAYTGRRVLCLGLSVSRARHTNNQQP